MFRNSAVPFKRTTSRPLSRVVTDRRVGELALFRSDCRHLESYLGSKAIDPAISRVAPYFPKSHRFRQRFIHTHIRDQTVFPEFLLLRIECFGDPIGEQDDCVAFTES